MKRLGNLLSIFAITSLVVVGCADTALAQGTTLTANPTNLSFTAQPGVASSATPQAITVTSTGGPVSFSVSSVSSLNNWLTVAPTSGLATDAGTSLLASVNANGNNLMPGMYPGTITLSSTGLPNVVINALLTVSSVGVSTGLSATPSAVTFSLASGMVPASQSVNLSTTGAATNVTVSASTVGGLNWLSVFPGTATINPGTPVPVNITANPTGLANGTYNGTVTVSPFAGNPLLIPVTLTVNGTGGSSGLIVSPNPVNFTIPAGSTSFPPQTVTVSTSVVGGVMFSATATTATGGNWLAVSPLSTLTATPSSPAVLQLTVNPTNLVANTYSGTITITPTNGTAPFTVPVNLTISGSPTLSVSPSMFSFAYQTGTAFPTPQTLTIGGAGVMSFSVIPSGESWLVVSPQNGALTTGGPPANVTVSVNPSGLPPGTYTASLNVISNGASNSPVTVPVKLVVSNQPILSFGNSSTTLTYQLGTGSLPSAQVQLSSSGNPLAFTVAANPVSGGNFLNVTPSSGTTPQLLTFTLNPSVVAGLGAGTYTENVTVTSPASGNSPQIYTVTLIASNSTLLTSTQNALSFNYQIGQSQPPLQALGIGSTGAPLNYAVTSTSSNCGNFLSASPANGTTMMGSVAVAVNTAGLVAGTCTGVITISSPASGNTISVPVSLFVSAAPLLNVSPSAINVITQVGTNPANQTVALTSTDPATPLNFTAMTTAISGGNWLLVGPTSGTTPANLNLGFNTTGLPVGTYNSTITVASTGPANAPVVIPVTLVIAPSATASTTPASLTFNQTLNGAAPSTQMLTLNSTTPGLNFTVSATALNGGNWLSVTPSAGLSPGSVTVAANGPTLPQGMYSGVVTFVVSGAANTPLNVPVTLIVGPSQSLVIGSSTVGFNFQAGSLTTPLPQNVQVTSTGGPIPFTAAVTSGASFLTVTPANGNTPGPVSIGLNQAGIAALAPGTYNGTVSISSPNLPTQVVNVTLTVAAAAAPTVTTVLNSASNQAGAVSPGEIVAIKGVNLGPSAPVGLLLTPQGTVSITLGNTVVLFDGIPAPLIFVSDSQINAIVPYEIAGRVNTSVVVQRNGQSSTPLVLRVADTSPAIFSLTQGGSGQGAILNFDNSVNGTINPAPKRSVIVIYATGEGALRPQPATGSVTSSTGPNFPAPINNVSVTIGGQPAEIKYAGEAPGLVSGALQINAIVPDNIGSGPQTIVLTVGGASNNTQTITVAVQ